MITHGWSPMGSRNYLEIAKLTCAALNDYNCMVFDWTDGATGMNLNVIYFNMRVVGLYMSHLIQDYGIYPGDLHLVGHSFGAHVMGYIGKNLKKGNKEPVARITGTDPAGKGFQYPSSWYKVNFAKLKVLTVVFRGFRNMTILVRCI